MISLDHIAIWSNNLWDTTYRLSAQTGLGNCDGGFFPGLGLGQKIISIGGDVYLGIESVVDHDHVLERSRLAIELERQIAHGDSFVAWCLRSDDMAEMEEFARHRGVALTDDLPGGAVLMSGPNPAVMHAPVFWDSWFIGRPNLYYVPDLSTHSSRLPAQDGTGSAEGTGVQAIEIGGTEDDLKSWLGDVCKPKELGFEIRYNGGGQGLYEVQFGTTAGTKSIRLNSVALYNF